MAYGVCMIQIVEVTTTHYIIATGWSPRARVSPEMAIHLPHPRGTQFSLCVYIPSCSDASIALLTAS